MRLNAAGPRAVRQLLSALYQLSQGQNADGPRHRRDGLAASGAGRHRDDAAVPAGQAAAQPSLVARQQRPRTCRLLRPGQQLCGIRVMYCNWIIWQTAKGSRKMSWVDYDLD